MGAEVKARFGILVSFAIVAGCSSTGAPYVETFVCQVARHQIVPGTRVRVTGLYLPYSMHDHVMRDQSCPRDRVMTYVQSGATGRMSKDLDQELERGVMRWSEKEYVVDVVGVVERDPDGLWVRITEVMSFADRTF